MTKEEISRQTSKTAEIPKVQDDNATLFSTPYYWSWYRCIFSRHSPQLSRAMLNFHFRSLGAKLIFHPLGQLYLPV